MLVTISRKKVQAYSVAFWLVLGVCSAPVKAEFKDPLNIAAEKQNNLTGQALIGSSSTSKVSVLVGPVGLVIVSRDSGLTWKQAEVPVQSDLVAVHMVNDSKGWAVGHDGVILATTDGGASWIKQFDGRMAAKQFVEYYQAQLAAGFAEAAAALELTELNYRDGPGLPYLDVWFRDESVGYVVGAFGNIARTDDGGETWVPLTHQIDNDAGLHLNSVTGIADDTYITSERGTLFKWNEEIKRFEMIETGYSGSFTGITGDATQVIVYGLQGTIYRSTDGGGSWAVVEGLPKSTINDGFRISDNNGFVFANQEGELVFTDPNMRSVDLISSSGSNGYTSVVGVSDKKFLATTLEGAELISLLDRKIIKIGSQEQRHVDKK